MLYRHSGLSDSLLHVLLLSFVHSVSVCLCCTVNTNLLSQCLVLSGCCCVPYKMFFLPLPDIFKASITRTPAIALIVIPTVC